jgi:hypothetical protein
MDWQRSAERRLRAQMGKETRDDWLLSSAKWQCAVHNNASARTAWNLLQSSVYCLPVRILLPGWEAMKKLCATFAIIATALVATSAVAVEPSSSPAENVVNVCKRHMIGLGPNYEQKFRLCAYLAGALEQVPAPSTITVDAQRDAQDLAVLRSYTKSQLTD